MSIAPSLPGSILTGHFRQIRKDVLGLMLEGTQKCGDVVRFRLGPLTMHLINHPDYIAQVLIGNRENYNKDSRSSASLRLVCGESVLTANKSEWQWRRKMEQPLFHHNAVAGFVETMAVCTKSMLVDWQEKAEHGEPVEVAAEMMRLTCRIVGCCLFGMELGQAAQAVQEAMDVIVAYSYTRWRRILNWPSTWPVAENLHFQKALASIHKIIGRLIANHCANPPQIPNLLTMLIAGCNGETGKPLTEEQIRNEALTFLLAGHETTANALSWTLYLLAQHPSEARSIADEVRTVLGQNLPTLQDLPKLSHTLHVFEESIRLYPPIWGMERHAIATDKIGGFSIPANSSVIISPYTLHRHPTFWEAPEEFRPSRFLQRKHAAYVPFGAGPRLCIGNEFALSEARVILALVVMKFDFTLVPGQTIVPDPAITLRLKNGLKIFLKSKS